MFHMNEGIYFTNSVTEIVADENAILDHIKLQEESKKAFHIARMEVDQERTSNFISHSFHLALKFPEMILMQSLMMKAANAL
jgi:Fe-S cluster assembly protein SufD